MARKPSPTQQAAAIVAPQYASLEHAQTVAARQTAKQQAALTAARDALIRQLQAGVEPAGRVYDQAVGQQQALAQAGAQGLAAANPNAQIQDMLQLIGAPAEQQAQLGNLTQAAFPGQGAVLNVAEGTVPGASLVAQKSAAQQFLAGLPLVAGLSGDQSLRSLAEAAQAQRDKYIADRFNVAAQIPGLATELQQRREDVAFRERERIDAIQAAAREQEFRAREAALDRQAQMATTPAEAARIAIDRARLQFDRQQANRVNPLDVYEAQTRRINAENARKQAIQGGGSGLSASKRYDVYEGTKYKVQQALGLEPGGNPEPVVLNGRQIGIRVDGRRFDYTDRNRVYNYLRNKYGGSLARAGVSTNSIKAMLNTALNQAGFALRGSKKNASGRRPGGKPKSYGSTSGGSIFPGG